MNRERSLRSVNLNLLPILHALLRERSLARAAATLNLSRPAVSAALVQLRHTLEDPLLVRVGRQMVLTSRAERLVGPVQRACEAIGMVLTRPEFDPSTARRRFVLAASDYACALFAPSLLRTFKDQAPGISVHFVNGSQHVVERMVQGDIDVTLAPERMLQLLQWPSTHMAPLWRETHVQVVRPDHPLLRIPGPTMEQIASWPQLVFEPFWYPDDATSLSDFELNAASALERMEGATHPRPVICTEQFCVLALLTIHSDAVAVLPKRLLRWMQASIDLRVIGEPLPSFETFAFWTKVHEEDPAHQWFRAQLLEIAKALVNES